jgi:hypothetical protein
MQTLNVYCGCLPRFRLTLTLTLSQRERENLTE